MLCDCVDISIAAMLPIGWAFGILRKPFSQLGTHYGPEYCDVRLIENMKEEERAEEKGNKRSRS